MLTKEQKFHTERRRCEQFFNAAAIRFRGAVSTRSTGAAVRAAQDLQQVIDEMLELAGVTPKYSPFGYDDCPDCGQALDRDEEGLTEGEQEYLDSRGEL
jgi:hypothetical protein